MAPSTRRSLGAQHSDNRDQQAEDVATILNEVAHSQPRSSGRKRKPTARASDMVDSSPTKRAKASAISSSNDARTDVPTPRRQSGRLKPRPSFPPPLRANLRNPYEIPTNDDHAPEPPVRREPAKKVKQLRSQTQRTASPLKGKGVVETRTTAWVNFDDSPQKKKKESAKDRLQRIGQSIQAAGQPLNRQRTTSATALQQQADSEDIFAVAAREESESELLETELEKDATGDIQSITHAASRTRPEFSPTKAERRKGRSAQDSTSGSGNEQIQTAKPSDPPSQNASLGQNGAALNESRAGKSRPPNKESDKTSNNRDDQIQLRDSEGQRPPTEAELQAAEEEAVRQAATADAERLEREERAKREAAKAEEERRRKVAAALRGFESISELYDCKQAWIDSLVAAAEVVEKRSTIEPSSTLGKAAERCLKNLIKEYKRFMRAAHGDSEQLNTVAGEQLSLLKKRCDHLRTFCYRPEAYHDRERARMGKDVYEHLIPLSLSLAKILLRARFCDHALSKTALEEVSQVLRITRHLITSAARWKPRPALDHGIKSKTKSEIAPSLRLILVRYEEEIAELGATIFLDELEAIQIKDREALHAAAQRKREAIQARHRGSHNFSSSPGSPFRVRSQNKVDDMDDLDFEDSEVENPHLGQDGHVQQLVNRVKPHPRREPMEEIPAPVLPRWDMSDNMVLLNALQRFTTSSRFQDIANAYGGAKGRLGKYDMDDIMEQSRWLRRSMARQLENELDRSWNWLRSVPS